jgi:ABC-2 type transport system ATP-binding protein
MTDIVIEAKNLTKRYAQKTALNDLSIKIHKGGVHTFIGPNGAGKSTFFRMLLGFVSPTLGSCHILGHDCQHLTPAARGRIGFVNEEHTLPPWLTVQQVAQIQQRLYANWDEAIYREVLGNFDVRSEQKISTLSKGERAGVTLSMAFAQKPELLILDEPTVGLDVVARKKFLEALLFTEAEQGCTMIYCSHQMEEVERVSDNLIILEKGRIKLVSSPDKFCDRVSAWNCDFPKGRPEKDNIPGLLQIKTIEDSFQLIVLDQAADFNKELQKRGAQNCFPSTVGLDNAVNAFLNHHHAANQAQEI